MKFGVSYSGDKLTSYHACVESKTKDFLYYLLL